MGKRGHWNVDSGSVGRLRVHTVVVWGGGGERRKEEQWENWKPKGERTNGRTWDLGMEDQKRFAYFTLKPRGPTAYTKIPLQYFGIGNINFHKNSVGQTDNKPFSHHSQTHVIGKRLTISYSYNSSGKKSFCRRRRRRTDNKCSQLLEKENASADEIRTGNRCE